MAIIIAVLIIYIVGMLAIGFMGKKSSESMNEFLTAGRSGGMFVMVCTYIGAHVGNGIVVGGAQYGADTASAASGTGWVPACPISCSPPSCPGCCTATAT